MSQQGPGGYGGGGYGPPGGPGGYGPPGGPGGYGPPGAPPPGGYPGAPPQGWGQPGQPGAYAPPAQPGAPQPAKKTNPLVFVALGCGALLVLGGIGTFVAITLAARAAANRVAAAAGAYSAALQGAIDAGAFDPDGGFASGTPGKGGPACEKAADCCKQVLAATGATTPESLNACESLRTNPAGVACEQALATYRVSARLLGKTCP